MELIYENEFGQRIDMMNDPRFALTGQSGLASLPSNVLSTSDTVLTEGDTVLWRKRSSRQIVMTHEFLRDVRAARREFVNALDQGARGRLIYRDGDMDVFIEVEVEDCEVSNTDEVTTATTTFVASYPYFQDAEQTSLANKGVTGGWTFPFTFPVTFGTVTANDSLIIENLGNFPFGFVADIIVTGDGADNIRLFNQAGDYILLEEHFEEGGFNGSSLRIDTRSGHKAITRLDTGESILDLMGEGSTFLQIERGVNVLTISASSGVENVSLAVMYRNIYKAV